MGLTGLAIVGAILSALLGCHRPSDRARPSPSYDTVDQGCPDIFAQETLGRYEMELAPDVWQQIKTELGAGPPPEDAPKRYHPVAAFRLGQEVRTDARVRLKGRSSWADTVARDPNPKAQFVVAFGDAAARTRFHGVRKISFDMPRADPTMLNERLAYAFMRATGLPAPCANSAEVYVNGTSYGLYTAKETYGGPLLERLFPGASGGVLLERGVSVAENADAYDAARAGALWGARDIAGLRAAGVDLDDSLRVWAAEALVNDADGYWGGNHNFYIYDDPRRGWRWLSDDVDLAFAWVPRMQHPICWWRGRSQSSPPPQHYQAVVGDPVWRARYVSALGELLDLYDVARLQAWLDRWAAQIAGAVARDPHQPFTLAQHQTALAATRAELAERAAYLRGFLSCAHAGTAPGCDGTIERGCYGTAGGVSGPPRMRWRITP